MKKKEFMKNLIVAIILVISGGANAQCFQLWGPSHPPLDSICFFTDGTVQLFGGGETKFQFQADVKFVPAHAIHRPGLVDGNTFNISDSYQYSKRDVAGIYLYATVPVQPPSQEFHTRYGNLSCGGLDYIVGQ
jgi:hypothetical protein